MKTFLFACLLALTCLTGFAQTRYNKTLSRWEIKACPTCSSWLPQFPITAVNGKVGSVVIGPNDIADITDRRWMRDAERFKLAGLPSSFGSMFAIVNGELRYIGTAGNGTGDMLKSAYDANNDGLVDNAQNAGQLGGKQASEYVLTQSGKGLSSLDFTAVYRDAITNLQTVVASLRQDLADLQNTVSTLGQNNINTVFSALRQLPLFGPNTLLGADANSGFTFYPVSSVTSTTTSPGSTTTTPSSGTSAVAYGDSTVSRINEASMSDVAINDQATLRNYLASDISDKRLLVSRSTAEVWEGYNEQTGAWTNVKLLCVNRNIELRNTTGSTAWIFQGGKARNRVCIEGFKFSSTASGGGYPVFWWNELPQMNGLEVKRCEFTAPNGEFNAMGCVQYSVSSGSGNIAKNIYIHHNYIHDVGRMGMEWLSQGYDTPRLFNFVLTGNTFSNLGTHNEYGMSFSFSGLIRQLYLGQNKSTSNKKVTYELVNTQDVLAEDNSGTTAVSTGKGTVGWGISDDDKHTTRNIKIRGGDFDVSERAFYIYGSSNVAMDGQNKLWKGHRGVQMNGSNNSFTGMNILIHSTQVEASWEITGGSNYAITNSKISSAGAVAAGYNPAFEAMVWRSGVTNTSADNVTTIVGLQSNGQPYASPENGGDGRIVNQGSNNTITNPTKSTAP